MLRKWTTFINVADSLRLSCPALRPQFEPSAQVK